MAERIIAERYRVSKLIARGGMSSVYLAHHLSLRRPVALKLLDGEDARRAPLALARLRREGKTLGRLDHPNIVKLHDGGTTDDGGHFLALEYVEGETLADIIPPLGMDAQRAVNIVVQVCEALRHAHARGFVHRDLKSSNVVVRRERGRERITVLDFGLVKPQFDQEQSQTLTQEGEVVGSPHWMSPEQIQGRPIDVRTDVYAVGVLMYKCLTGLYPFDGDTATATMIAHLEQEVRPPSRIRRQGAPLPFGLDEVVVKALAKHPDDRFQDMADLIVALSEVAPLPTRRGATPVAVLRQALPRPSRRTVQAALVTGVLLGTIVGGLAAGATTVWMIRPTPQHAPAVDITRPIPVHVGGKLARPDRSSGESAPEVGGPLPAPEVGVESVVRSPARAMPDGYLGFPD